MQFLMNIRNKTERFVKAHLGISSYVLRLLLLLISLLILRGSLGFNSLLSNLWITLAISVCCAFIPVAYLPIVIIVYIAIQLYSLSIAACAITVAVLILVYLLYFRFRKEYFYIVAAVPILFLIKGQLLIVLILAICAAFESFAAVGLGVIVFYILRFIITNAPALNQTSPAAEGDKVTMILKGTFISANLWVTIAILLAVFVFVRLISGLYISQANSLAIIFGTALYVILQIISELLTLVITGSMFMTYSRLLILVVSSIICLILAIIAVFLIVPQDYARAVRLRFDDEEYYYYVRAVPKATFEKEPVSVKQINVRKTDSDEGGSK